MRTASLRETPKSGIPSSGMYLGGMICERNPMHTLDAMATASTGVLMAISGPEAVGVGIIIVGVVWLALALGLLAFVYRRRRDRMRR